MMNEEKVNQMLKQALSPVAPDEVLNQKLKEELEGKKMRKFKVKKTVILVAACCMMLGTVGLASSGVVSYITVGTSTLGEKDFSKLKSMESKAGFSIKALENFQNGYTFTEMHVAESIDHDENDNVLAKYKEIELQYEKAGADVLSINVMQAACAHSEEEREPDQTVMIGDIEVAYMVDTYKWVPAGYELTEEDKANMERDDYFISEGVDKVSESQVSHVVWVQDGIRYSIMNVYGKTEPEVFFQMAKELIIAE